jgi:hypothetical protein
MARLHSQKQPVKIGRLQNEPWAEAASRPSEAVKTSERLGNGGQP